MKRFLEDAVKMIRINSVTKNGNEELANFVSQLLEENGFKVELQNVTVAHEDFSKRQFNVLGILGDPLVDKKIRKGLLLNTHLDTVSPGLPQNWTETGGDAFHAVIKDGKIFGLGSADVKLDFLCKVYAASRFRDRKLKMPIYLVGTCGEEVGMFGVKYLIQSGALNPKYVVVGEPSDLKVVYAHKCLNILRVSIQYQSVEKDARGFNRRIDFQALGKSAHGSYPHLGYNAILSGIDFLKRATDAGFEFKYTQFQGGETINKVPDLATFEAYLTSHQLEDFKRFYREFVQSQRKETLFKVEVGGLGGAGIRFLPDTLFPSLLGVIDIFSKLEQEFIKVNDTTYNPSHSTLNLGQIRQNPGRLDLFFDLRILPDLRPDEIFRHLQVEIQKLGASYPNLNLTINRDRINPGLNMTLEHDLVRLCRESMIAAGVDPQFDKKATSTEAAQYFQAGYEAVVFGPGKSMGNSHSPNEYNILEHLEKATAFYENLIERTCL